MYENFISCMNFSYLGERNRHRYALNKQQINACLQGLP
jgi:hypothetical protein